MNPIKLSDNYVAAVAYDGCMISVDDSNGATTIVFFQQDPQRKKDDKYIVVHSAASVRMSFEQLKNLQRTINDAVNKQPSQQAEEE